MLTIHRVRAVRPVVDGPDHGQADEAGYAVVVRGDRLAAVGPFEELFADVRRTGPRPGVGRCADARPLRTGRRRAAGGGLPPRPARGGRTLGSEPVTGEALAALGMTDARWGASARRGLQRLMATGTTALTGPFHRPAVRTAVERSGLRELAERVPRSLVSGGCADFAVFAEDGGCLVTALHGRLVFRRR